MNRKLRPTKSMQQIKEEKINFLLEDVEKKCRSRSVQESNKIKRQPTR